VPHSCRPLWARLQLSTCSAGGARRRHAAAPGPAAGSLAAGTWLTRHCLCLACSLPLTSCCTRPRTSWSRARTAGLPSARGCRLHGRTWSSARRSASWTPSTRSRRFWTGAASAGCWRGCRGCAWAAGPRGSRRARAAAAAAPRAPGAPGTCWWSRSTTRACCRA
jgi:hypothetical protein